MPLLDVNQLCFAYNRKPVVDNLSFSLEKGQIMGFLGQNGAGKSTTMNMLAGVQKADSGYIRFNGEMLDTNANHLKSKIGYLPEIPPLYPDMTVKEFLLFCAALKKVAKAKLKHALDFALQQCQLEKVQNRLIGQLSKGFAQRVGIAQAIIHQPDLIILDEPTVGLDPLQIQAIRELIASLGKNHAVILSTHILAEVESICTHVQILHQGKLVYQNALSAFEQNTQTEYRLSVSPQVQLENIPELPGISQLNPVKPGEYRLLPEQGFDAINRFCQYLIEQNIHILALCPQRQKLEDVFLQVTRGQ